MRSESYGLINLKTGKAFPGGLTFWQDTKGGKWMKIWQDGKAALLDRTPLHGQSYRILCHLDAVCEWGNVIPAPAFIASKLGIKREAVYRAYAELIKAEIVIKKDGNYYLSPLYCWKGNQMQLVQACKVLLDTPMLYLGDGAKDSGPAVGYLP